MQWKVPLDPGSKMEASSESGASNVKAAHRAVEEVGGVSGGVELVEG